MKTAKKGAVTLANEKLAAKQKPANEMAQPLTLGKYAHQVIDEQYHKTIKQQRKVLADKDPEHLHQMRVGTRRLRTALQVFQNVVEIPKAGNAKQVGKLARVLGALRDLDVQLADLETHYRPKLPKGEQKQLDSVIATLQKHRRQAFTDVEDALTRSRYQALQSAYETWLKSPQFTVLSQLPLLPLLPDLLSPLLSTLLLHPGWLAQSTDASEAAPETLHDLRKACKHVRYQAEFFADFYGDAFKQWIEEIKTIQAKLGSLQDSQVLLDLLDRHLPKRAHLPTLQAVIQQAQTEVMIGWEDIRCKYLDSDFRYQLHQMLLSPRISATSVPSTTSASSTLAKCVSAI